MNFECPNCKFKSVKQIQEHLYLCNKCNTTFKCETNVNVNDPFQFIFNPNINRSSGSGRPITQKPTEVKDTLHKVKYNKYTKGEGIEKLEFTTIDYENATGTNKPESPVVKETNGKCRDTVLHLLNEMKPPEYAAAALKIKECFYRDIKVLREIDAKTIPILDLFNQITKDMALSKACEETWNRLNQFINGDEVVKKYYVNETAMKGFFTQTLDLFENLRVLNK